MLKVGIGEYVISNNTALAHIVLPENSYHHNVDLNIIFEQDGSVSIKQQSMIRHMKINN